MGGGETGAAYSGLFWGLFPPHVLSRKQGHNLCACLAIYLHIYISLYVYGIVSLDAHYAIKYLCVSDNGIYPPEGSTEHEPTQLCSNDEPKVCVHTREFPRVLQCTSRFKWVIRIMMHGECLNLVMEF